MFHLILVMLQMMLKEYYLLLHLQLGNYMLHVQMVQLLELMYQPSLQQMFQL